MLALFPVGRPDALAAPNLVRLGACLAISVALLLAAPPAHAGDPVPDIDVTIEQIPGDDAAVHLGGDPDEGPARFDEVVLELPRKARDLTPVGLPEGWVAERRRGELVVSGPEVETPVRLRFEVAEERPGEVGVTVKRGGEVVGQRRGLVPREVPVRRVRGTLSGIVQAPAEIAAGDTLAFRALDEDLPTDGQWTLSGVVAEPWNESLLSYARTILNTTRSNIRLMADLPDEGIVLEGAGGCDVLVPVGAVLLAEGAATDGAWTVEAGGAESGADDPHRLARLSLSPGHRGLRTMISIKEKAVSAADLGPPADGFAVKEEGVNIAQPGEVHWRRVTSPEGDSRAVGWTWVSAASSADAGAATPLSALALRGEPTDTGCRLTRDRPSDLAWARAAVALAGGAAAVLSRTGGGGGETVYAVDVPFDWPPGEGMSFEYVDTWGDPWVDVPSAEGIEVTGERPPSPDPVEPTIEGGSAYASAGGLACLCGDVPFTSVFRDVGGNYNSGNLKKVLDGAGRGLSEPETVASGGGVTWIRIPESAPPGRLVLTLEGVRGEVALDVVRIDASLDQNELRRGQGTPMRLTVVGSDHPLPLSIVNRSPQIISIEGGDEQRVETSGGPSNTLERQVRALTQGAFDLSYELESARCPCPNAPVD